MGEEHLGGRVPEIDYLKKEVKEQQVEVSRLQKRAEEAGKKLMVAEKEWTGLRGSYS